ncbi:MAG TPA: PepSY domain-containing protein, partial [Burkholderiales bacterium]|nr:PepSY domain-containing protein [Burkholderiales bacterium]
WSDVWGGKVQEMAAVSGLGRPAPPAEVVPDWELEKAQPAAAHQHHESPAPQLPWALQKAAPPHSAHTAASVPIDVDAAQTALARAGLPSPYNLTLPRGPRGAYMATYSPSRIEDVRVVYLDQYNGAVLDDVGFARFGPAAKAIEWGIAVHQGQEYGPLNRYLMLFGCLAIVVLAVSAITMWWKRRPPASLGVPPRPANPRVLRGLIAIMVPIGLFYPLVGLSFIVALTLERAAALVSRFAPHH